MLRYVMVANTVWAPAFVYLYDPLWASCLIVAGFIAEFGTFRLYVRGHHSAGVTFRRLFGANLLSCAAGFVLMVLLPFGIRKDSFAQTALAFGLAYFITLLIENYSLRSLFPQNRRFLFRSVAMANFVSHAILFGGFVFWFGGLRQALRIWTGDL